MQKLVDQCIFLCLLGTKRQRNPWLVTNSYDEMINCTFAQCLLYSQPAYLKPELIPDPSEDQVLSCNQKQSFLESLSHRSYGNWSMGLGRRNIPSRCSLQTCVNNIGSHESVKAKSYPEIFVQLSRQLQWLVSSLRPHNRFPFQEMCVQNISADRIRWKACIWFWADPLSKWISPFKEIFSTYDGLLLLTVSPINFNKAVRSNYKSPSSVTLQIL